MLKCVTSCRLAITALGISLGWMPICLWSQQPKAGEPLQQFGVALTQLAPASPDDCGWEGPSPEKFSGHTAKLEDELFDEADDAIVQALNVPGPNPKTAIAQVLDSMRALSEGLNKTWPADRRFHYELLEIDPAFVVTYHIRSRSTWSVFGIAAEASWPNKGENTKWSQVGEDDLRWQQPDSDQQMEVYGLTRGPSGLARFLARASQISCGDGITGLTYHAYEWNPASIGSLDLIIERKGAASRGDFPQYRPIGKLEMTGPRVTLPYCEWSAVDLDVDALLCSVDTYDVSGDEVRFLGTRTNRPDLEAVAKAVKYADDRDYRALLSYSASPAVARKMVALMPPSITANVGGGSYPPLRGNHQAIDIGGLHFALEERNGTWVVVEFTMNPD